MRRCLPASLFFVCCVQAYGQPNGARQPKEFFSHPDFLCSALEDNGVHAGPWRQIGLGFFSDQSERSVPGPYFCEYPQWVAHSLTGTPSRAGTEVVRPPGPDTSTADTFLECITTASEELILRT